MLHGVSSERLPAPIAPRVVQVPRRDRSVTELHADVERIRHLATVPPARVLRRVVFMWFRIYVHEQKHDKHSRVNIRIPIPLPVLGVLFPHSISRRRALSALAVADAAPDAAEALADYLDSAMGIELIRVDDRKSADVGSLVVIGLD